MDREHRSGICSFLSTKKPAANCVKISAGFLSLGGFVAFIVQPKYWNWVLGVDRIYFSDLTTDTILFIVLAICAVEIVSSMFLSDMNGLC